MKDQVTTTGAGSPCCTPRRPCIKHCNGRRRNHIKNSPPVQETSGIQNPDRVRKPTRARKSSRVQKNVRLQNPSDGQPLSDGQSPSDVPKSAQKITIFHKTADGTKSVTLTTPPTSPEAKNSRLPTPSLEEAAWKEPKLARDNLLRLPTIRTSKYLDHNGRKTFDNRYVMKG